MARYVKQDEPTRNTALCYVRQSLTRDGKDKDSPERQRANITAYCERMGWQPEFYEDAEGHKTGTKEANRPGWLSLKARLSDPDVTALVANDLSRLHRKGWRVGDLIDYLDTKGVTLVLAAPGREIDLSTPMGRLFVQFTAILDEWYAADISQRAKDTIAHRKAQGKTVGMPPFGTVRGADGYLKPSTEGAWLMPDGTFVAGNTNDTLPYEHATFKGYYEAAHFILTMYATGHYGLDKIAYAFNEQGWAFRDRKGNPRMVFGDDIRRVVANFAEYGGLVMKDSTKKRRAYISMNVDEIPFYPERAVFPVELIRQVAQVRHQRSFERPDNKVKISSYPYPLSGITRCAHCERLAGEQNNANLRSFLSGKGAGSENEIPRYRHKPGTSCGVYNRSVPAAVYEADFRKLIQLLTIKPEMVNLMTELAIQADKGRSFGEGVDFEQQKQEAIALCHRRIDASVQLYGDGMIDREEYQRRVEANRREIQHWQTRTSETEKLALEFAMCLEAVDKIVRLWDAGNDEDRQGVVRTFFEYVVYDWDKRRIVDFKLKVWAERYLILRSTLYREEQKTEPDGSASQGVGNDVLHTGFEPVFWP